MHVICNGKFVVRDTHLQAGVMAGKAVRGTKGPAAADRVEKARRRKRQKTTDLFATLIEAQPADFLNV